MGARGKRADMVVHGQEPYNAEPPPGALADDLLTPVGTFYSRNHGQVPDLDPQAWRLRVDGLVDQPLELSLADLRERFEEVTLTATLQCAGNRRAGLLEVRDIPGEDPWGAGATSTAAWTGVSLAAVLTAAGVRPDATHVAFCAPDRAEEAQPPQPYGGSIGRAKAMAGEVLLAWAMNGEPLAALHGAPVRVVVPGYVGARSVKWVERVTAQDQPSDNYYQAVAYRLLPADCDPAQAGPEDGLPLGPVALNAAILRPEHGQHVPAGPAEVAGYALAGDDRGIARVEVSVDGGATWVQAALGEQAGPWAWRLWLATVELPTGEAEIVARAWDTTGATQPESAAHVWNPKGYANSSWARVRVTGSGRGA